MMQVTTKLDQTEGIRTLDFEKSYQKQIIQLNTNAKHTAYNNIGQTKQLGNGCHIAKQK